MATIFDHINAANIQRMRIDNNQKSHQSDRIDRLRNDSTMLCVANTLVNIANINNGSPATPSKHIVIPEQTYQDIKKESSLEDRMELQGYHKPPMKFPYKLEISDMSSFPLKLMEALSNEKHKEIISWLAHGRGFMIFQTKEFVEKVMPKYFKQTKFPSFTRKLSRWGFTRVQRGPEVGVYYHDLFLRDNPTLCLKMRSLRGKERKLKKITTEKKMETRHATCHSPFNDSQESPKGGCADQGATFQEDCPIVRNEFNTSLNMNSPQSSFLPANESMLYRRDRSVNNSEDALRSLASNACIQNTSHSFDKCTPENNVLESLTAMQGMSHVPSLSNTGDHNSNMSNSLLENLLRTVDTTQSNQIPQSMPSPDPSNVSSMKMQMARSILIKSALQQIGRDLGVVM